MATSTEPPPDTTSETTATIRTKPKASPLNADFAKLVRETLDKWHIPGVAVAVVDGDDTWAEGYGSAKFATDGSPDTPVTPSTLFWAGSTTKTFTAAATTLLVDDDEHPQVQWTTPLRKIIGDDFELPDEYATSHVTLEDALSHRSGLSGEELTMGRRNTSAGEYTRLLRHFTGALVKDIRTTWQYCNGLFIAVGHMVEVVTGQTMGDFLGKRVWGPLGMSSTFWTLEGAKKYADDDKNATVMAVPYGWDESSGSHKEIPYFDGVLGGEGAVISTVTDYAKYLRCIMRKTAPISAAGHVALRSPRSIMPHMMSQMMFPQFNKQMLYSLGWMLTTYQGEDVMLHPGGVEGMSATMICFPEREWAVTVFNNSDGQGSGTLAWHLIDEMLGVPQDKRVDVWGLTQMRKAGGKEYNKKETALKRLFPGVEEPQPLSLPLEEYTGTYRHPVYPSFVVTMTEDSGLKASADGAFPVRLDLDHATADQFMASLYLFRYAPAPDMVIRAEFELADGKVKKFGAVLGFTNMSGTLIWFDKQGA